MQTLAIFTMSVAQQQLLVFVEGSILEGSRVATQTTCCQQCLAFILNLEDHLCCSYTGCHAGMPMIMIFLDMQSIWLSCMTLYNWPSSQQKHMPAYVQAYGCGMQSNFKSHSNGILIIFAMDFFQATLWFGRSPRQKQQGQLDAFGSRQNCTQADMCFCL